VRRCRYLEDTLLLETEAAFGGSMAFDPFDEGPKALTRPGAPVECVLTNAEIVLEGERLLGTVVVRAGRIVAVDAGASRLPGAIDCEGDYLLPGLVDVHTDNLEKHYQPRSGVTWDGTSAAIAHDGQVAASGITTVYDSLTIGAADGWDVRAEMIAPMLDGLDEAREHGMLRVDHRLHLRCEVTHPGIVAEFESHAALHRVDMVSLMDHAPGDRQSPDIDGYRDRYLRIFRGEPARVDAHIQRLIEASRTLAPANRRTLAGLARERGIPLATHDDASRRHVEEAVGLGAVFSEFPTTVTAARAARSLGLATLMGTPNLLRGGSHSGNVAAGALAEAGLLDLLASDYIPASLIKGAFRLAEPPWSMALPEAVAMVTSRPAAVAGLADRGRIATGLRADLVRVRLLRGRPIVREVLVEGHRVA
jgi:alpha-D-ribose 1-methylphosphonate 5-triphosphate diphosphatase